MPDEPWLCGAVVLILAVFFIGVSCKTAVKPLPGSAEKVDPRVPDGFKAKADTVPDNDNAGCFYPV